MFVEVTPDENLQDLKKIRGEKGLSLEDLFAQTRVRVAYLQAIENKDFHLLPVPVYSRNFIKIYARALGIDSEPLIREYDNYINSLNGPGPSPSREHVPDKKNIFQKINLKNIYLAIAFILLIVFIAHWFMTRRYELSPEAVKTPSLSANVLQEDKDRNLSATVPPNKEASQDAVLMQKENAGQPALAEGKVSTGVAKNETVNRPAQSSGGQDAADREKDLLTITATEDTWLRIKADENPPIKVFLKAGEKFQYKAKSLVIDIGNAGGIKVKFKEKNLENLGKTGEVVHLRLP